MPCIKNSAARCDCGCVVKITVVDWCEDEAPIPHVNIKVYAVADGEPGELLIDANTGESGVYDSDLVPGNYLIEPTKTGYHGYNPIRSLECGVNVLKLTDSPGVVLSVRGCPQASWADVPYLSDARIVITGPRSYELHTTNNSVTWYPEEMGSYHFLITHPSGRFEDVEDDRTISATCIADGISWTLEPRDDYTCCYTSWREESNDAIPRGKILVATSAGDSWFLSGDEVCYKFRCTVSEPGQGIGTGIGDTSYTDPPEPGAPGCPYGDYPHDLHYGTVGVKVRVRFPMILHDGPGGELGFNAEIAPPSLFGLRRIDPMTVDAACSALPYVFDPTKEKWWYTDDECPDPEHDTGWTWLGVATVHSHNPLSVEVNFSSGDPECWVWSGTYADPTDCQPPPPIHQVTITEVL